ncbi:GNAT family N-acetyltransferase [Algibacter mikhailovii]|uniref:BioF2-like acetyltransferase domain-containing protein n=1 Tax=Algibacter mikhailovii TaxID=425498 RepID=A0A918V5C8_9FLAO|nr:GNAT family N-acetyltransferase [Algibacter mikhailovii]GGZ70488.1 hypothetical protein GCM10007028_04540 [Algibacter mikhailovii]
MEKKNSPFSSRTFQDIWKKKFIPNKTINTFKFLDGISFYKNNPFIYCNVGKNLTKGNAYTLGDYADYKNKTFIIYDVIPHLNKECEHTPPSMGLLKTIQYPGFLIDLDKFKNIDDYLLNSFSKGTRSKLRKYIKRLHGCFDISTKMFYGDIDTQQYNDLFDEFKLLLEKRYSEKQMYNNNMQPCEWNFYKEIAYPLILEKKASLFVIYNGKKPIAITLCYHSKNALIDAITVFDIDYAKFNVGYVNNLKLMQWCFDNNITVFDFSKGAFQYKERMCTLQYNFEYHIIYDKKSIISKLTAYTYYNYLEFKTYLRSKQMDVKLHALSYRILYKNKSHQKRDCEITKLSKLPITNALEKINIKKDPNYLGLSKSVNNFLYLTAKSYEHIESYKVNDQKDTYILASDSLIQQLKYTE